MDYTNNESTPLPALPARPLEAQLTALPSALIERIFARMSAMYGSRFADMWAGTNAEEVKATWGEALGRFTPEELRGAIDACLKSFEYPPSLPQFFNLCKAQQKPAGHLKLNGPSNAVPMPDWFKKQWAEFKRKRVLNVIPIRPDDAA